MRRAGSGASWVFAGGGRTLLVASIAAAGLSGSYGWGESQEPDVKLPAGYEQLVDRGVIPAIVDPIFIRPEQATIDDDAYVLGTVIEGRPRAFSLNLLNAYEIVNGTIGDTPYAAVW